MSFFHATQSKADRLIVKMREKTISIRLFFPFISFAQHHVNNALNICGRLGNVSSVLSQRAILVNKNPCLNHLLHEEGGREVIEGRIIMI